MWWRIRCLIIKELLAIWRDPKTRFIVLVPPVIQMVLFTHAATQEVKNVAIAVFNQDLGTCGRDLVARFEGSPNFRAVYHLHSEPEIATAIDSRSALMVVCIGVNFSRELAAHRPASVQIILDGRSSNSSQILAAYAEQIVNGYNDELAQMNGVPAPASTVVARSWFNPNLDAIWNIVPTLVAILVTLEGLMITGLSIARERELGTFEQLLVSPLSPGEIVIGKAIPAYIVGIGEGTMMLLVAVYVFHVPLVGSVPLLYLAMSIFLLAVIGLGLFVSSLARTQQQAILGTFSCMVPMSLLSGFASPVENMPDWLQYLTVANPLRHFVFIVKGVFLKALPATDLLQSLWPLIAIAVVTLVGSSVLFRRRTG